jgi:hypothetical protein
MAGSVLQTSKAPHTPDDGTPPEPYALFIRVALSELHELQMTTR